MNYEDLKWMNQSLWSYIDKSYDTHGYLDISVSINTSDDITFSPPKLVFNLDNQGQRRSVRLSYSNVVDLIDSLNYAGENMGEILKNPQSGDITKRYNKDKDFIIEFRLLPERGEAVASIKISHNYSDQGKIIIPMKPDPVFKTLGRILRMFEDNYVKFSLDMPNRYLASLQATRLNSIENLIKIIPTQLAPVQPSYIPQEKIPDNIPDNTGHAEEDPNIKMTGTRCSMCGADQFDTPHGVTCKNGHGGADAIDEEQNEFEQFADENVDSVRIPELEGDIIEKLEPTQQGYQSPFIGRMLKNNIHNLETMLFALFTNSNPLKTIMDTLHEGQTYTLLPGATEKDIKSILYLSNLYFKSHFQSYVQNQTAFPSQVPVVKYKGIGVDRETIELSHDLLMVGAYLKIYRNRMEAINADPYTNGALIHFAFRCFLDVATYSYLNDTNIEAIKNCITSRYKSFSESGFFGHYDRNLEGAKQRAVTLTEIIEYIDKVFNNVVDQEDVDVKHFNAHDTGTFKIPPVNNFTVDQITNEIVKYEIKTMFGQRIEDLTGNEEIIIAFNTKLPKKYKQTDHRPEPRKTETHVLRYIKLKANEIPERFRTEFVTYIEEMGSNKYDFINSPFKTEELNDTAIKSLYVWNDYIEDNLKYTDYVLKVEDCIDKDLIIAKVKDAPSTSEESDWSSTLGNIEL